MAFRRIDPHLMLKGTLVATVEKIFPEGLPSLSDYCEETGIAPSTFRRSAESLLGELAARLQERHPGPRAKDENDRSERERALRELESLRAWLLEQRRATAKNNCFSPEAKQRIASVSEEIQAAGVLSFNEIAEELGIDVRQLNRIRTEVAAAGGEAPQEKSRRPHTSPGELSPEIQALIATIEASADSRNPYGPTDIKRILEKNYKDQLRNHHGSERIAASTVSKYMASSAEPRAEREHPRGSYRYPEPFQQAAIDTSHFKLFGATFYLITVLEMGGRLNLLTRVFLRENTQAVVRVLEEYLNRYPSIEVTVIDRGTPYLNDEVKQLLESGGRLRLVCPPATPTAKAACERHFKTLKTAIRKAAEVVLRPQPALSPETIRVALEFGAAVFCELYHHIAQEGIDGKSPAERIESFDPVRASASMIDLFERALNSEPAEDFARRLHAGFQLSCPEEETAKRLRQFGTPVLRRLSAEVSAYMGPPQPWWMHDPLGYLAVKAREIFEKERRAAQRRRYNRELQRRQRHEREREEKEIQEEAREWREHPERFIDRALALVVRCVENGFSPSVRMALRQLRELFASLRQKLGHAVAYEITRLRARVDSLTQDDNTRETVNALLDEMIAQA